MRPRFSKTRQQILAIVSQSPVPLSAHQVYGAFGGSTVDLATIYRGLEFLEETSRLTSFSLRCSRAGTVRYFHTDDDAHLHFFHCVACHRFFPYHDCIIAEAVTAIEQKYKYSIHSHVLYFTGICNECKAEQAEEAV